jgi:beta-1,4-mannosyltransferase
MVSVHRLLLNIQIPLYMGFIAGGIYLGLYLGSNEIKDTKDNDEEWWTTFLRALNLICIFHIVPVAIGFMVPHKKAFNCIEKLKELHGQVPTLYIRYVTRGNNQKIIEESVNSTLAITEKYDNIIIEVATDCDVLSQEVKDRGVIELTVPDDYETEHETIYKARALQYALEHSNAKSDDFILHMDEESHLTERALMGIYQHMYQKPDNIGQGMITYRRSLFNGGCSNWKNKFCALADTIRIADDLSRFRLSFIFGNPIFGCKGSYLVMKTQIEKDVTMNMPPELCITEDASFAFNAYQQKVKFAFVEGELEEISPSNFLDFIKQRARWIKGLWLIVLYHKCSIWRRIIIAIDIIAWAMMFLNIIAFVSFFVLDEYTMPVALAGINGFIFASYVFSYIYGGWVGGYGVIIPILNICLMPFFLLLETTGALYGFLTVGQRDFYVIKK